ncbi:MAG: glycosyltransferase [Patescibacteria group bacterium]
MISIIISTYREEHYQKIAKNIKETIGQDFEIIPIENKGTYSIAEAYNLGAQKARYPFLCFVHEDIVFQTNNWGQILLKIMDGNNKIGLIGVAGTKLITKYSLGWHSSICAKKFLRGQLNQGKNSYEEGYYENFFPDGPPIDKVTSLDGIFLFTKKEIWQNNNFDEKIIKGFHGYDLDFSLQVVNRGYEAVITKDILLHHYSYLGKINKDWFETNKRILKKWKQILPKTTDDLRLNKLLLCKINILFFIRYLKYQIKFFGKKENN